MYVYMYIYNMCVCVFVCVRVCAGACVYIQATRKAKTLERERARARESSLRSHILVCAYTGDAGGEDNLGVRLIRAYVSLFGDGKGRYSLYLLY